MKRWLTLGVLMICGATAFAQSGFTIRRPANGSIVRETVKVRIPKSSIPQTGYVGIVVNGKFLEAVAPAGNEDFEGNDFVYKLNTKEREIVDGNLRIEAILYADFGDASRVLSRSSVRVVLDNKTSLKAPANGYRLRYNFGSGREYRYKLEYRTSVSMMSEAQARMGGRAPELPQAFFKAGYSYSFDNKYNMGNGKSEGLVRMQIQPDKGKDYAVLPLQTDPEPKKRYEDSFYPIYMRVTDTGREIFGRSPYYIPMEGSGSQNRDFYIFGNFPLPILPTQGVSEGSSWSGAIVESGLTDIKDIYTQEKISNPSPARGTLEAIEYERGMRCARIRNRIATTKTADVSEERDEVYWFSLDLGMIVRLERNFTTTNRIREQVGGGGGATAGGGRGGRGGLNAGGSGAGGNSTRSQESTGPAGPTGDMRQSGSPEDGDGGGGRDGRGGGRGGRGGGGGFGAGQNGGGGGAGGSGTRVRIVKSRTQFVLTLE